MPIVAAVTRASASKFFSQQAPLNPGNTGGNAYTLRKADGTSLGTYRSVAEAQSVFNRFHGPGRVYRWERRDLAGDIEQHVCIGTPLNAQEIWVLKQPNPQLTQNDPGQTSLQQLAEPQAVKNSVNLTNVTTGVISSINDISGSGHPLRAVEEPLYIDSDADFLGSAVVDLDQAGAPFNGLEILTDEYAISPPFTLIMVANNLNSGANGVLWNTKVFPKVEILDGPAGVWRMTVEATGDVDSATVGDNTPDILVIKARPLNVGARLTFRVNGVDEGYVDAVDIFGGIEIGGFAIDPFDGHVAFHMIAGIADADDTRIRQTERYLHQTYGTRALGS
jgi:hypothetical protein